VIGGSPQTNAPIMPDDARRFHAGHRRNGLVEPAAPA
jgi:hypothetical protein